MAIISHCKICSATCVKSRDFHGTCGRDECVIINLQAQLKRERELTDELVTSINDYLSSESVDEAVLREVDLEERIAAIHSEREGSK